MKAEQYKRLIEAEIEDEETPATVSQWALDNAGKQLRSNNVPDGFKIRRQYGMTHLEPDGGGYGYLIAHSESGVDVPDVETLRELSPAYYGGLEKRNAYRRALLADPERLQREAKAISQVQRTVKAYRESVKAMQALTDYPHPARHQCDKWAGVIDEQRQQTRTEQKQSKAPKGAGRLG